MDFSRFSMEGRTVIITGGSGGIGMGCAKAFAQVGANIVIVGVPAAGIAPAVAEIEAMGVQALGIVANVANAADVDVMVKQTMDRFGRIDTLVNVAGGTYSRNPEMP
jgi:NAD(P)-dependent dehydrogenase (short-subunit alcohol dehydrogenase family)